MITLGVLVSGSGTNLQAILDAVAAGTLDAKVAVVVSNVAGAKALARAEKSGVPTVLLDHKGFVDRASFDAQLVEELRRRAVDYVVLAGFMRLLTPAFLDAFPMRVLNVHPGLLPAFPGVDAQAQALRYGVRVSGCTVHFVDSGTDTGPIVAQAVVPVLPGDDEDALRARILAEEHRLLPRVLQWCAEGRVKVSAPRGAAGRHRVHVEGVDGTAFGLG
ncbi:MAG TPA: phosphoribosylglycinamide formyltransferase [Polyangiaceae bacterium]|jgi:phosphoribosylglycinamide formyltransferase-1